MSLRYAVKMGRPRVHDDATAEALLQAAEGIVARAGFDALTVRAVAEATGSTTRAVYSTAGSKQALVSRLGARGFDMLGAMVDAIPVTDDPAADLVEAGWRGFRRFAVEHPALFLISVQLQDVPSPARTEILEAGSRALRTLRSRVQRLQSQDGLGHRSLMDAVSEFHALCEGLAAVELRGFVRTEDAERIWLDALGSLVRGWRTTASSRLPGK